MVGAMIVPELTDGQPAIWSPAAITLLRSLGYQDAVIYSDSLTAEAVPGSIKDAVIKAWVAGIDIALIVQTDAEAPDLAAYLQEIIEYGEAAVTSRTVSADSLNQSVLRIFDRKQIDPCSLNTLE